MRNRIATASTVTCRNMTFAITANTISVAVIGDCSVPTKTCITIWANFPMHHASDMKGEPMDLIDRQQAIDAIMGEYPDAHYPDWYASKIRALSSVQPERKTGRWIGKYPVTSACSECNYLIHDSKVKVFAYCPNCGADMRGEQE